MPKRIFHVNKEMKIKIVKKKQTRPHPSLEKGKYFYRVYHNKKIVGDTLTITNARKLAMKTVRRNY